MSDSETETRYLFLNLTEQPNAAESQKLAGDFCLCYARLTSLTAEVIETEADDLDAIVRIDREEIGLEFVRYHGDDAYLEIEQSESQLKGDIGAALKAASVPDVDILIWWPERSSGRSRPRVRMPTGDERQRFINEVIQLAKYVVANPDASGKKILLSSDPERMTRLKQECELESREYAMVAKYCSWLRITIHDGIGSPEIRSSATTRSVGLDETALREAVSKHCLRRYFTSRKVWLIVHSVGIRASSYLPEPLRPRAMELIRRTVVENQGDFGRVFWAENTGYKDSMELFEVTLD